MVDKIKGKKYRFPADLGHCIARLAELKAAIEAAAAKGRPAEDEWDALREHLLRTVAKSKLDGAKGSGLTLAIKKSTVPSLKDWKRFFKFASLKGNDDLLMRQVNTAAWRERNDKKRAVPGVEPFQRVSLSVQKSSRRLLGELAKASRR